MKIVNRIIASFLIALSLSASADYVTIATERFAGGGGGGGGNEVMRMDVSGNIPGFMFAAVALPKTYAEIEAATTNKVVAVNIHNSLDFPNGDREVTANVVYSAKGSVFVTDPSGASTEYPNALIFHSRVNSIKRSTDYYLAVLDVAGYGTAGFVIVKEEDSVKKITTPNNWETGYVPEYGEESGLLYLPVVEYEQDDMTGQYSAVTVGTREEGSMKGEHSVVMGLDGVASGNCTLSHGYQSKANGSFSAALGVRARSDQDYSFVWQGVNNDEEYASHDDGTFNVNPNGGTEGFYIGQTKLSTITNDLDTAIRADMQTNLVVGTGTANKFLKNDGTTTFWAEAGGGGSGKKWYVHRIMMVNYMQNFMSLEIVTDSSTKLTSTALLAKALYDNNNSDFNRSVMAIGVEGSTIKFVCLYSSNGTSLTTYNASGNRWEEVSFNNYNDTVQEISPN